MMILKSIYQAQFRLFRRIVNKWRRNIPLMMVCIEFLYEVEFSHASNILSPQK
uniref:Uncharacterized protein n=1 Tax=Siphoviridae sp. ctcUB23 TaxID=2825573 RepID=A0A8S5PK04_9CAUD|nr:MAG TPA: hypothetical protein [Siphoviridae sp. ctcUB23]